MYSSRRWMPGGAKSATTYITSLHVAGKIILTDFNLVVSTLTVKLAKFNSLSNFLAIQYHLSYDTKILKCKNTIN